MAGGSLNRVMIIGKLGQDPELRYTTNQIPVATFSVATNDYRTGQDGQRQELTEWHRIVAWNKLADLCGKYLTKGRSVFIEGRLQTRSWDDKQSGQKRYTTEIVAQNIQFLGEKSQGREYPGAGAGDAYQKGRSGQGGMGEMFPNPSPAIPEFDIGTAVNNPVSTSGFGGPETPGMDDIPF